MAEAYLKNALKRLNQAERYNHYVHYLKDEWISTKDDLFTAVDDDYTWDHLKLPARLKLEIRRIVLEEKEQASLVGDSSSRQHPSSSPSAEEQVNARLHNLSSLKKLEPVDSPQKTEKFSPRTNLQGEREQTVKKSDRDAVDSGVTKDWDMKYREKNGLNEAGKPETKKKRDNLREGDGRNKDENEQTKSTGRLESDTQNRRKGWEEKNDINMHPDDDAEERKNSFDERMTSNDIVQELKNSNDVDFVSARKEEVDDSYTEERPVEEDDTGNVWKVYYSEEYQSYYYYNTETGESQWAAKEEEEAAAEAEEGKEQHLYSEYGNPNQTEEETEKGDFIYYQNGDQSYAAGGEGVQENYDDYDYSNYYYDENGNYCYNYNENGAYYQADEAKEPDCQEQQENYVNTNNEGKSGGYQERRCDRRKGKFAASISSSPSRFSRPKQQKGLLLPSSLEGNKIEIRKLNKPTSSSSCSSFPAESKGLFDEGDYKGIDDRVLSVHDEDQDDDDAASQASSLNSSSHSQYYIISEDSRKMKYRSKIEETPAPLKVEKYKIPKLSLKSSEAKKKPHSSTNNENSLFVEGVDYGNLDDKNFYLDASAPPQQREMKSSSAVNEQIVTSSQNTRSFSRFGLTIEEPSHAGVKRINLSSSSSSPHSPFDEKITPVSSPVKAPYAVGNSKFITRDISAQEKSSKLAANSNSASVSTVSKYRYHGRNIGDFSGIPSVSTPEARPYIPSPHPSGAASPVIVSSPIILTNRSKGDLVNNQDLGSSSYLALALGSPALSSSHASPARAPSFPPPNYMSPDRFPLKAKAQPTPLAVTAVALDDGSDNHHNIHSSPHRKKKHKFRFRLFGKSPTKGEKKRDEPPLSARQEKRLQNVRTLKELGYAEKTAIFALEVTDDNLNEAIIMLTEAMGDAPPSQDFLDERNGDYPALKNNNRMGNDKESKQSIDYLNEIERTRYNPYQKNSTAIGNKLRQGSKDFESFYALSNDNSLFSGGNAISNENSRVLKSLSRSQDSEEGKEKQGKPSDSKGSKFKLFG
jgi:hypothetical protein